LKAVSNHNISEFDLIEGCKQGNRQMQSALYQQFSPKMYGICLRYAANTEEAEDILQEGFIKVFSKIDSFRSEGSFEGWVRRIFVNTAIEQFRKKKYTQAIGEQEENTLESSSLSALDGLGEKDILQIVQQLSPGYRTVFNLYVIEGYSHREISEMLGINEGTSKSQLSRAKIVLQELVKKQMDKNSI